MKLKDALELNRNLESPIHKMDLGDHLICSQASVRFRSWDLLRFCYALWSATGSPWYSRLKDLDMQIQGCQDATQQYIRKPSGVHKSKYRCTKNNWTYVKTCLCMHGIMFKSYQW